nr:MAG TPA: hypothetical protein [Bacteriophage sp.]
MSTSFFYFSPLFYVNIHFCKRNFVVFSLTLYFFYFIIKLR